MEVFVGHWLFSCVSLGVCAAGVAPLLSCQQFACLYWTCMCNSYVVACYARVHLSCFCILCDCSPTDTPTWVPVGLCALVHGGFPYRSETGEHIRSIKWVHWVLGSNIDSGKVNTTPSWLKGQRWQSVTERFGYLMALWGASLSAWKIMNGATWKIRQAHIKLVILDIDADG